LAIIIPEGTTPNRKQNPEIKAVSPMLTPGLQLVVFPLVLLRTVPPIISDVMVLEPFVPVLGSGVVVVVVEVTGLVAVRTGSLAHLAGC